VKKVTQNTQPKAKLSSIHPSRKPSLPTHPAATASASPPRQAGVASLATVAIDLLCALSSPTESRTGLGAVFFSPGFRDNPRGVTVTLNRECEGEMGFRKLEARVILLKFGEKFHEREPRSRATLGNV